MKLYIFTKDNSNEIITQVRAENHDEAISIAGVDFNTDFYSTEIE